jgi:hypothetical protein
MVKVSKRFSLQRGGQKARTIQHFQYFLAKCGNDIGGIIQHYINHTYKGKQDHHNIMRSLKQLSRSHKEQDQLKNRRLMQSLVNLHKKSNNNDKSSILSLVAPLYQKKV